MTTVEPFGAVPEAGTSWKTVPFAYWDPPVPCWTDTWNPAVVSTDWAVCWESPTTEGTGTSPPETVRVIVVLGGWLLPAGGLSDSTCPVGAVELGSDLIVNWKPFCCKVVSAWLSCWPTTLGTGTGCTPVETYSVTTVFAATLLPSGGLELITMPLATVVLALSVTL